MINRVEVEIGGRLVALESGRVAKQANGAILVRYGDTIVLVAAVTAEEAGEEQGFFPLIVDYREKSYAAGKIPGGFFKREGRPSEKEILAARQIDRPIRPFFPKGYLHEVQIMATVLSYDQENDPDILSVIGASAALSVSDIPFQTCLGAVKVGLGPGGYIINPTASQMEGSRLNITVVGTRDSVVMVEGAASEVTEGELLGAIKAAGEPIARVIEIQEKLKLLCGREKRSYAPRIIDPALERIVLEEATQPVEDALAIPDKETRRVIFDGGKRIDGRGLDEIRPITCEVGVLPRTHGSALFTRGQTQALAVVTLGTSQDEQRIDDIEGESTKAFMLHYNFPPYSVGEVRMPRGPARREIGHGVLAERALKSVIPPEDVFPYTIRIVADILESNGSSSMATVCSGSLSLMDAGVPVGSAVAGIAMGLIKEENRIAILTDILGDEDKLGDMDFKVTGTRQGITAFQMDIKIEGISSEIIEEAVRKARTARLQILETMDRAIPKPRPHLSPYAPRIISIVIPKEKIGDIIGPGGKVIRRIIEETGAKIEVEDDGSVTIASVGEEAGVRALEMVKKIIEEPEVGKLYHGTVKNTLAFGAFVEILPRIEGLVHISELDHKRVARVEDIVKVGDKVWVKLIGIDDQNRLKLSRKAALDEAPGEKRTEGNDSRSTKRDKNR